MQQQHHPDSTYFQALARDAGVVMRESFGVGMKRTIKSDKTPLTEADTTINDLVLRSISRDFPHIRVVSEEGDYDVDGAEYTVLCDPIDGTIPFCRGMPIAAFAISVLRDQTPLVSTIYDPFMDRMWHATRGEGAYLNDERIRVSTHDTVDGANLCMIWWATGQQNYHLHEAAGKLLDRHAIIMDPMSLAYMGGLLACGEFEATIFPGAKGWETAAMQVLVEEAGGRVTDIYGDPMRYTEAGEIKGSVVSNGLLHDELIEVIASCQP